MVVGILEMVEQVVLVVAVRQVQAKTLQELLGLPIQAVVVAVQVVQVEELLVPAVLAL